MIGQPSLAYGLKRHVNKSIMPWSLRDLMRIGWCRLKWSSPSINLLVASAAHSASRSHPNRLQKRGRQVPTWIPISAVLLISTRKRSSYLTGKDLYTILMVWVVHGSTGQGSRVRNGSEYQHHNQDPWERLVERKQEWTSQLKNFIKLAIATVRFGERDTL